MSDIFIPSSPEDQKKIFGAVRELSDSMTRAESEKDLQKDIVQRVHDEFGLDKSAFKKLAKVYHKDEYQKQQEANESFETLYETIIAKKP